MPSSLRDQPSASVVDLAAFRVPSPPVTTLSCRTAELLSLRQSLNYEASLEIDDLDRYQQCLRDETVSAVMRRVRHLLDCEFGRLRVHRSRRHFIVRHRSVDALIAGLLRVQFHTQQIRWPDVNPVSDPAERSPVNLTWGVGQSGHEAALQRMRRRRRKG